MSFSMGQGLDEHVLVALWMLEKKNLPHVHATEMGYKWQQWNYHSALTPKPVFFTAPPHPRQSCFERETTIDHS